MCVLYRYYQSYDTVENKHAHLTERPYYIYIPNTYLPYEEDYRINLYTVL